MAYTFWQNTGDIRLANGKQVTYDELKSMYPHVANPNDKTVVTQSRAGNILSIDSLGTLCEVYKIDESLTDDEALAAINETVREQAEAAESAAATPSPEERIAAMMEYQALASLPDEA
jgi:hypothetical protein